MLLAVGERVTSGVGGHIVILREAGSRTRLDDAVQRRMDRMRRTRHQLSAHG